MVLLTRAQGLPAAPSHHGPGVGETVVFWALPEGPPPQLAPTRESQWAESQLRVWAGEMSLPIAAGAIPGCPCSPVRCSGHPAPHNTRSPDSPHLLDVASKMHHVGQSLLLPGLVLSLPPVLLLLPAGPLLLVSRECVRAGNPAWSAGWGYGTLVPRGAALGRDEAGEPSKTLGASVHLELQHCDRVLSANREGPEPQGHSQPGGSAAPSPALSGCAAAPPAPPGASPAEGVRADGSRGAGPWERGHRAAPGPLLCPPSKGFCPQPVPRAASTEEWPGHRGGSTPGCSDDPYQAIFDVGWTSTSEKVRQASPCPMSAPPPPLCPGHCPVLEREAKSCCHQSPGGGGGENRNPSDLPAPVEWSGILGVAVSPLHWGGAWWEGQG